MENVEIQINIYKEKITKLINKLNITKDIKEQKIINDKIKIEQEFLNSLYEIYNGLINNNNDNKQDENTNKNKIKEKIK